MKQMVIIGAGGHGRVVADIAELNGYRDIVFLDDNADLKNCGKYEVVGRSSAIEKFDADVFVAVGSWTERKRIAEAAGEKLVSLIHPNAVLAKGVHIGTGTVVMAGAVINPGSRVGNGCIINTSSSVDHDCWIRNYVHIAGGAHLAGAVTIGDSTWIGAGATVSNNVTVCSGCMIGAGTVVIKDLLVPGIYIGVPAKKIDEEKL